MRFGVLTIVARHWTGTHMTFLRRFKPTNHRCWRYTSTYFRNLYPLDQQSIILPGPERIHAARQNNHQHRPSQYFSEVTTVYEAFQRGKQVSNDGPYLGKRPGPDKPYEWISYSQASEKALQFGSGLLALGEQPGCDSRIGIFSKNRPEWVIADLACVHFSMVTVPFYDSLGAEACQYIINQTEMSTLICDNVSKAESLSRYIDQVPTLKRIILMDHPTDGIGELETRLEANGRQLISFDDVLHLGVQHVSEPVIPTPDSLYTIIYTSGTTGLPKGVLSTNQNIIANHAVTFSTFDSNAIDQTDIIISYLPLAHIFERAMVINATIHGAGVGFYRGDPLMLLDDMQALQPTIFLGVPKVYNRIYQRVTLALEKSNLFRRTLFRLAFNAKLKLLKSGTLTKETVWDKLVFRKIQDLLGGKIRLSLVGGAPVSPEVIQFFKVVLPADCLVMEGYGQTEVSGCISHTVPHEIVFGHVGIPGGDMQIKLVDVPELEYYADDDKGEICVRGSNVCSGYFKNPVKTNETIDGDGWLHTGDIGQWNANGTLKIIDRRGYVFKLSNGEFIAPEKIETVYGQNSLVEQAFVYGDSTKSYVVGVFVLYEDEFVKHAEGAGFKGTYTELCTNQVLRTRILDTLRKFGQNEGLQEFEQIRSIHISPVPFINQIGLLTPTLKNIRHKIADRYRKQIDEMYVSLQRSNE